MCQIISEHRIPLGVRVRWFGRIIPPDQILKCSDPVDIMRQWRMIRTFIPVSVAKIAFFKQFHIVHALGQQPMFIRGPPGHVQIPQPQNHRKYKNSHSPCKITPGHIVIILFLILELLLVNWGTPAPGRMFAYFMDEWHGVQAIRSLATKGTINVDGAALGTVGYYALSGAWLVPSTILKYIDPWAIKNPAVALFDQQKLFWILRSGTWLWAIVGIVLLHKLTKNATWLVVFSPIWLAYSSVFKYDIPVAVGLLIFIWRILIYADGPTYRNWIWAVITTGLVTTLKFSLLPLLPWLAVGWWLYTPQKNYKQLLIGVIAASSIFIFLGIPDLWLPGHVEFWRSWLTIVFAEGGSQAPVLIWTKIYPELFGWPLYLAGLLGLLLIKKDRPFWLVGFGLFAVSLLTIGIGGVAGRATVLLPFLAIGATQLIRHRLLATGLIFIQLLISLSWWKTQIGIDTRLAASNWIQINIPPSSTIGVPNIPIYQKLPDILVNDFYGPQYQPNYKFHYTVEVSSSSDYIVNPSDTSGYQQIAQFKSPQSRYDPIGGLSWQPTIQIFQKIK